MYRLSCDVIGLPFRTTWLRAGMNPMPMGMGMQQQPAGDFNLLIGKLDARQLSKHS